MARPGPAPGSGRSGGTVAAARRGGGSSAIVAALNRLEGAIRAAIVRGDIGYSEAEVLYDRADRLAVLIEERLVCGAADYPDEEERHG